MPKINQDYKKIYDGMNNGIYDTPVRTAEKGFNVSLEISVEKVKEACRDAGIDFNTFLKWAQARKAKENAE